MMRRGIVGVIFLALSHDCPSYGLQGFFVPSCYAIAQYPLLAQLSRVVLHTQAIISRVPLRVRWYHFVGALLTSAFILVVIRLIHGRTSVQRLYQPVHSSQAHPSPQNIVHDFDARPASPSSLIEKSCSTDGSAHSYSKTTEAWPVDDNVPGTIVSPDTAGITPPPDPQNPAILNKYLRIAIFEQQGDSPRTFITRQCAPLTVATPRSIETKPCGTMVKVSSDAGGSLEVVSPRRASLGTNMWNYFWVDINQKRGYWGTVDEPDLTREETIPLVPAQ